MKRLLLLLAFAVPAANAQVQTTTVSPALEVQRLAPQLVGFAGSDLNFANLVNGLALGVPVTLTTPLATGGMQLFSFAPSGTMTPVQIAQVLESARQSLIARGIATPTAQQLGTALAGGSLATATGATAAVGQSPANAIQNANSTANATNAAAGSTAAPRNMSDSALPRGIADTPPLPVPGVTSPVATTTLEAARPPVGAVAPIAPTVPGVSIPGVRTGDR